jgi:hypothetical protein
MPAVPKPSQKKSNAKISKGKAGAAGKSKKAKKPSLDVAKADAKVESFVGLDLTGPCMTIAEASAELSITKSRVVRLCGDGLLEAQRDGRKVVAIGKGSVATYREKQQSRRKPSAMKV